MVFHKKMLAPIHSIKHYVHRSNVEVGTGVVLNATSVTAIAKGAARSNSFDVEEGAVLKAIHLEYWLCGTDASVQSQFTLIVYKQPSESTLASATDMANLGSWDNKKNILFSSQGVLPQEAAAQSIPVIREWIKIPKGKQRFGLGEKFQTSIFSVGTLQLCGLATYKEYE